MAQHTSDSAAASAPVLRIDYVSPLPPVRSGIADYSVDLLTAIAEVAGREEVRRLEVRVVQVEGQPVSEELQTRWSPVPSDQIGTDGRLPVYHMGNNPYHAEIYEAAVERPGVVVLHDVFLHHLLQERTLAKTDVEGYIEALERDHGWVGKAVAMPPRWSGYGKAGLFTLAAHRSLLQRQRGIVVHSEWAATFLREEGIERPIRTVPMVMPAPELSQALEDRAAALRAEWQIARGAFVLGSFGFQTPIKRTSTAIRALAQPGLEQVHLVVGGDATRGVDLLAEARRVAVEERVHLIGFLEAEDFSAAIRACDLTVNLRYPTAGETSASLLRILALGRPAVVSDYAQFRDIPASVAVRVGLGDDPQDQAADAAEVLLLGEQLRELVADRPRVSAMGEAARDFVVSHHAPYSAAAGFVRALSELAAEEPPTRPASRQVAVPSPTSLTWGQLDSELLVEGVDDWAAGELREVEITLRNRSFAKFLAAKRGPGGVMLELRLLEQRPTGSIDWMAAEPWVGLPRDLPAGDACTVKVKLRRPITACELIVAPHVVGGHAFERCGGAVYRQRFD